MIGSQEGREPSRNITMVPKGRLELPQAFAHYALNVARLPIPPLRHAGMLARGSPSILEAPKRCQAVPSSSITVRIAWRSRTMRVGATLVMGTPRRLTNTVRYPSGVAAAMS
jgi:hypothetical protein